MRRLKIFAVVLLGLICAPLITLSVSAQEAPAFGGNNASDYQPPTGNPQNDIATGLQTNNTPLQPVPGLGQQGLLRIQDLKVSAATSNGADSTASSSPPASKPKSALPTMIIGGILTFAAVMYVLFKPDEKLETKAEAVKISNSPRPTLKQVKAESKAVPVKPKAKPVGSKKTTRKKRKAASK